MTVYYTTRIKSKQCRKEFGQGLVCHSSYKRNICSVLVVIKYEKFVWITIPICR